MSKDAKIAIVDYGVGNLYSLLRAFKYFNIEAIITEDPSVLQKSDGVVLPGVGAFETGMRGLKIRGLVNAVKKFARENRPMLGICLGAQIMMTEGHEFGIFRGLNIFSGRVMHFPKLIGNEKVPHVGWNSISSLPGKSWSETILRSSKKNDQVYFVHSYIINPEDKTNVLAVTTYGGYKYCSAIRKGNIYGFQFHPEKSGVVGLNLIHNFIKLCQSRVINENTR